jgi:hypothetical protein
MLAGCPSHAASCPCSASGKHTGGDTGGGAGVDVGARVGVAVGRHGKNDRPHAGGSGLRCCHGKNADADPALTSPNSTAATARSAPVTNHSFRFITTLLPATVRRLPAYAPAPVSNLTPSPRQADVTPAPTPVARCAPESRITTARRPREDAHRCYSARGNEHAG